MKDLYLVNYKNARENQTLKDLILREIPETHAISFLMPSLRFGVPLFTQFASPAHRRPGQPVTQGPPDRWWAINANSGRLMLYALWQAMPFCQGSWPTVELPRINLTIEQYEHSITGLYDSMEEVVPLFFRGASTPKVKKGKLVRQLGEIISQPILDQYSQLSPDFFDWLKAE